MIPITIAGWWVQKCSFHNKKGIILPIDELHHFSRWLLHHQPVFVAMEIKHGWGASNDFGPIEQWPRRIGSMCRNVTISREEF